MNPPYCPNCGTRRDARFSKRDGQCVAVHCLPCGIHSPCCPKCGHTSVRRTDNQLALECHSCPGTFPDPKKKDDEWNPTPDEVQFLLNVGESLSSHIGKLLSLDQYEEKIGKKILETRYIGNELKYFIVIPSLLEWRQKVLEKKAKVPDVDYIANKLLTENVHYRPTSRARIKTAGILRKVLAEALNRYREKPSSSIVRRLILAVVESELRKGSNYKVVLEALYEKDNLDLMDMDLTFKRYKSRYGVSNWIEIKGSEAAKNAFQVWLSRCRKKLERGRLELDL